MNHNPVLLMATAVAVVIALTLALLLHRLRHTRRTLAGHALAGEKYRLLVSRLPALVWTTDRDLRFTSSEGAGLAILGLTPGQVVGMNLFEYFKTDDPTYYPIHSHHLALDGHSAQYEFTWSNSVFQTYLEPLRDDRNRVVGVIGLAVDITESRQARRALQDSERQLLQAQKMDALGSLAGGIAHDFNNILTPILGYAHLVQQELDERPRLRRDVRQIERAAVRARDLVRQILAFGRQPEEVLRPLDLNAAVNEAVSLLRASIPPTVNIQTSIPKRVRRVMADPSQIHQIVLNLGTNAWHSMEQTGGTLRIEVDSATVTAEEAEKDGGLNPGVYARLSVSDTGAGMPRAVLDRIFEPFFTTKEVGKGAGLGLSVIHGLVSNMGGVVLVDTQIGEGTRFSVFLPLTGQTEEAVPVPPPSPVGNQQRVLVVDDEDAVAHTLSRLLDQHGYRCTVETDPLHVPDLVANDQPFDVIVTDLAMPGLTGAQMIQDLRQAGHQVPAILLTGYRDSIDPEECGRLGIRRLLLKPVAPSDLRRAVHDVLSGR